MACSLAMSGYLRPWRRREGLLDSLSETHLFALHYIFIPRIQISLNEFRSQWNDHAVSSTENFSPEQLFIRGTLSNCSMVMEQNPRQEDETIDVIGSGIDLDTDPPVQISDDDYDILVPIMNVDEELMTTLQEHINPLDDDGIMG